MFAARFPVNPLGRSHHPWDRGAPVTGRRRLAAVLVALLLLSCERSPAPPGSAPVAASTTAAPPTTVASLIEQRRALDRTVWRREVLAQRYGQFFVELFDALRTHAEPFAVLRAVPWRRLTVEAPGTPEPAELGVSVVRADPERIVTLDRDRWDAFLDRLDERDLTLSGSEWRHVAFDPAAPPDKPAVSHYEVTFELGGGDLRLVARARLRVEWAAPAAAAGTPVPDTIAVRELEWTARRGAPGFVERLRADSSLSRVHGAVRGYPFGVYDLDGDGLSEIYLAGWNTVFRNRGQGRFEAEAMLAYPRQLASAGVIADFDGDGAADFVAADRDGELYRYAGDGSGRLDDPSVRCWSGRVTNPTVLAAGDIDRDGDLDLWVAQYKPAYSGGQMPTPIDDANDGYPSYLLENDGSGTFTDVTSARGLAPRRFRRTYSSSFVDLDDDGDLDLLVVSDFAGVDLYRNDGHGAFADATDLLRGERTTAGMAHAFADFDGDGGLDFYVIGMSSATVRRLDHAGLGREERPEIDRRRGEVTFGNRLFLARPPGFVEAPFASALARTGWSWGASAFDCDNDGDADLFVGNGHISGRSALDYCTDFWRHDVYLGSSREDATLGEYFSWALGGVRSGAVSWNGFERNVLLLNQGKGSFRELGGLFGVAEPFDARAVVTDDLDGDGRVDLVVIEEQTRELRPALHVVHVKRNLLRTRHHWIGVRLREEGSGFTPLGARVVVTSTRGRQVTQLVTGDSYLAQHPTVAHFGLGAVDRIDAIEVRWTNGSTRRLLGPEVDRYHTVRGRTAEAGP